MGEQGWRQDALFLSSEVTESIFFFFLPSATGASSWSRPGFTVYARLYADA